MDGATGFDDQVKPQTEYRLIQDDNGAWYVIPLGEERTFVHWQAAMRGERHMPGHFEPRQVDGPHSVAFREWREIE